MKPSMKNYLGNTPSSMYGDNPGSRASNKNYGSARELGYPTAGIPADLDLARHVCNGLSLGGVSISHACYAFGAR